MSTPTFLGATPGQLPQASQINQFLTTHPMTVLYTGATLGSSATLSGTATNTNGLYVAQSFTPGTNQTVGRWEFTLAVTGSPGPLVVSIRPDNAGAPSATVLASVTVPNSFIPGAAATVSVPLPLALTAATTYWVVFAAVGDASNFYAVSRSTTASGASTSPDGVTWTPQAYGLNYRRIDQSVVFPVVHLWVDGGARWAKFTTAANGQLNNVSEYTTAQGGSYVQSAASYAYASGNLTGVTQGATVNQPQAWSAARSGLLGDTGAVDASAEVNQFLGAHPDAFIYKGNAIVSPRGTGASNVTSGVTGTPVVRNALNAYDRSQPFTMVGTTVGRVAIPFLPLGTGADVVVSLCTDNAGAPGTIITSTRIPANWVNELAFCSGTNVPGRPWAPIINATGNPLALAQFNAFRMNGFDVRSWPYPSVLAGTASATSAFYGNYLYLIGGVNSSTAVNNVFSAFCDNTGTMSPPVAQPALPQPADGSGKVVTLLDSATANPVIVQAGGGTSFLGPTVDTVYTAEIDPTTGALSAWSVQIPLPYTVQNQGMAGYNGYVYVIGGSTTGGPGPRADVVFAQVQNTQITGWTPTTPLPEPVQLPFCTVSNGFLFVMGGADASLTTLNVFWYAKLNADGTVGQWFTGPSFPAAGDNLDATPLGSPLGVVSLVNNANSMAVTPNGLDIGWTNQSGGGGSAGDFTLFVQTGDATFLFYSATTFGSYSVQTFTLMPNISVPLPATGLTNGATYHILMQSPTNDPNNFMSMSFDSGVVFPGDPKTLHRAKGTNAWVTDIGASIPITIYDQTATGTVWHTWGDGGARVSTLAYATTPDQRLLGILEATAQPGPVLNQNYAFTASVAPWTPVNGAAVQSSAFTHGGLPFSALFTPTGGNAQAYIESERIPILLDHTYTGSVWFYSPTGYANCSVILNWYDASNAFISSSFGTVFSVPANTWTFMTATGSPPLATAVYGTMGVYEKGTPPNTAVFYASAPTLQDAAGLMVGTVTQVNWAGVWPDTVYPPLGTTQLA